MIFTDLKSLLSQTFFPFKVSALFLRSSHFKYVGIKPYKVSHFSLTLLVHILQFSPHF